MNEVLEFPAITPPVRSYIPPGPWRAILADGRWSIVGMAAGESCTLDLNPFRKTVLGDATMAMRVATTLNEFRRVQACNRLLLSAIQMFEEARAHGVDAGADLIQYARQARGSI